MVSHSIKKHSNSLLSISATGLRSAVRRRIQVPVENAVKDVQKNVAKVAMINPNLKTVDTDVSSPVKDTHKLRASSSAHQPSKKTDQELRDGNANSSSRERTDAEKFPEVAPPAKREGEGLEEDDLDQDFDIHGFDHPSTYAAQPWIWIPKDGLGMSQLFVKELRGAGVEASDEGALMDYRGNVEVDRNPPDEDWTGGHDA